MSFVVGSLGDLLSMCVDHLPLGYASSEKRAKSRVLLAELFVSRLAAGSDR
jgi:hypothetical protein